MKKLKNIQSQHSSFWLGKSSQELYGASVSGGGTIVKAIKMRSYQRAVSNFVKILTKKEIPVQFAGAQSFTTGKAITISADISNKNFDVAVGLALHEASHIILTDFNALSGISGWQFSILNWVEDRRIDAYVMANAPGYKEYYNALYRHYFIYEEIAGKYLRSTQATKVTTENYVRQIINMLHPEFKANALPGLQRIVDLINTENISRLKSTQEVYDKVCLPVYEIIEQMVALEAIHASNLGFNDLPSTNPQVEDETPADDVKPGENQESEEEEQFDETYTESTPDQEEVESEEERIDLTSDEVRAIDEAMEKMESFARGELPQSDLKGADKGTAKILQDIGNQDIEVYSSQYKGIRLLVHDITRTVPDWSYVEGFSPNQLAEGSIYSERCYRAYIGAMEEGLAMGASLGRKLQLVNEQRTLVTNRLKSGSIDKRRLAGLGYGIENVFNQITTEKHRKANLHISLDSSGSMSGRSWMAALKTTVAIARAAQSSAGMITLQVSTRDTGSKSAVANIIYDSRFNGINTLLSNLSRCTVSSLTPEGLCFEGLLQAKKLIPGTKDVDSYFINVSDGEPCYNSYSGYKALAHTKRQVDGIKSLGISVLSFYVSGDSRQTTPSYNFKNMYGKDAKACTPDSLTGLAKVLNSKFLEAKEVV